MNHSPASLIDLDLDELTTDDLEQILIGMESVVSQARHVQTLVAREVDRRQAPLGDGVRTLGEWLSGRIDLSPETARSLSDVARADSPILDDHLSTGSVSFA